MKKLIALMLSLMLVFALCACGADEAEETLPQEAENVQIANPMVESTAEEIENVIGEELDVPDEATEVVYYIIAGELGEAIYVYDGAEYCLRVQKTEGFMDISGIYFIETMEKGEELTVQIEAGDDGTVGAATWYDDGFSYSISMSEGATEEALTAMYELVD